VQPENKKGLTVSANALNLLKAVFGFEPGNKSLQEETNQSQRENWNWLIFLDKMQGNYFN